MIIPMAERGRWRGRDLKQHGIFSYASGNVLREIFCVRFGISFWICVFPALLAICSILELEAAISTCHVAWYFATRVHLRYLRLVYGCLAFFFGLVSGLV